MLHVMAARTAEMTDDDFLVAIREEAANAIGFDNDDELASNREKALEYFKGEVDIAALPNRSQAVSTDLADAVHTLMPDIMEVLTGGEDVATFRPKGEDDEEAAAQETDYVNHVIYAENAGWVNIHAVVQDALLAKIGVGKVWGEETEEVCEEQFLNKTVLEMELAEQDGGEIVEQQPAGIDAMSGEALWNFTLRSVKPAGRACHMAVPPEDFSLARDTGMRIADTTYCAMRSRPRAQNLIADGYDPALVEELSPYGSTEDSIEQARDQAGEHNDATHGSVTDFNLHQVEVVEHYIRVDADGDGYPELWCVVTNADATTMLKRERVDRIPFFVATPFLMAHRLIGMSLYDLLREVMRIKTVMTRGMLDSLYFALNQRYEVATAKGRAGPNTLDDLLNNVPGSPVRSEDGQSVRPLGGAKIDFPIFEGLEYMSTVGEGRTGIVRNAQGLNPDTLHDTAKGAMALMGMAQRRVRMIIRVLVETGFKDMYLLTHDVVRTTVKASAKVRLRGKWVEMDPSQWGSRNDMDVEVGVGSGGREMELAALNMVADRQAQLVEAQGGFDGPFVSAQNVHNLASRLVERAGLKRPDRYFSDPAQHQPGPPKPDPEAAKVQAEMELERYKVDQEMAVKREQMAGEFALERERMAIKAKVDLVTGAANAIGQRVELGGDPG